MSLVTLTDENGKVLNLKGLDLETVQKILNKSLARKNKTQHYKNLLAIRPTEGNKGLMFVFEGDMYFTFSFVTKKFEHGNGNEWLPSHYKYVDISYMGERGFWDRLARYSEEVWIKKWFAMLNCIADRNASTKKEYATCNKLSYLLDGMHNAIQPFESIVKAPLLVKYESHNLVSMSRNCSEEGQLYGDAKAIIKKTFNNWFVQREGQETDRTWDVYGPTTLKSHYTKYTQANQNGIAHIFEYCWDKYNRPINFDSRHSNHLDLLIKTHNYDYKRLIDYIMFDLAHQGKLFNNNSWNEGRILQEIYDYVRMNSEMGVKFDKYPKHFATQHDITAANYNFWKKKDTDLSFKSVKTEKLDKLVFEDEQYCVIAPQNAGDIIMEGSNLSHCVASYVNDVINGKTIIMFMREKTEIKQSLITIQVHEPSENRFELGQTRGHSNRDPYEHEKDFLNKYRKFVSSVGQTELFKEENKE